MSSSVHDSIRFQSPDPPQPSSGHLFDRYSDVVVAGAGMGGLSFLLSLLHHHHHSNRKLPPHFRLRVLERDESPVSVRSQQGYTLSLRSDGASGGIQVLDRLGLMDSIEKLATPTHGMMIADAQFHPMITISSSPILSVVDSSVKRKACRMRRYFLRELLLREAENRIQSSGFPASILFDSGIESAREDQNSGKVLIRLLNGTETTCDLLIAADGASSKIRDSIAPGDRLRFNGATGISGTASFPRTADSGGLSQLPDLLQQNHCLAIDGGGHSIFTAAIDGEKALWFLAEKRSSELGEMSREDLQMKAQAMGLGFTGIWPTLFAHTSVSDLSLMNCKDKNPTVIGDLPTTRVILIGDAAHAVSPFAGNGANMALMDGFDLAKILIESPSDDLSAAIKLYDEIHLPRVRRTLNFSHRTIEWAHSSGLKYFGVSLLFRAMGTLMSLASISRRRWLLVGSGAVAVGAAAVYLKRR